MFRSVSMTPLPPLAILVAVSLKRDSYFWSPVNPCGDHIVQNDAEQPHETNGHWQLWGKGRRVVNLQACPPPAGLLRLLAENFQAVIVLSRMMVYPVNVAPLRSWEFRRYAYEHTCTHVCVHTHMHRVLCHRTLNLKITVDDKIVRMF